MKRPKIVLAVLVAGIVALTLSAVFVCWAVRRSSAPTPPVLVTVVVSSPGRSASELEHLVAMPLEDQLSGIPSLRSLKTWNTEGTVRITCEFDGASAPFDAMSLVRDHVRVDQLPEEIDVPVVGSASRKFAIARYDLTHDALPLAELVRVHDERLRDELLSMPGVERLETCGAGEPEVLVELDPHRLEALGVRAEHVRGEVGRWSSMRILGASGKLEELGELIIGQAQSRPIRLNDVASIRTSTSPHGCACVVDGKPALCVSVFGWKEAGAKSVVDRVRQWAESAPPGLRVRTEVIGDQASSVRFGLWASSDAQGEKAQKTAQLVSSVAQPLSDVAYRVTMGSDSAGSGGPSGELSSAFKGIPAADFEVRVLQAVESSLAGIRVAPLQRAAWEFVVRGPDRAEIVRVAQELRKLADAREGVVQALVVGAGQQSSVDFRMKGERARILGIVPHDVLFAARLAVHGELVGAAAPGRPGIRMVWAGGGDRQLDQLRSLRLPSASGASVPLGEVVEVSAQMLDDPIVREDRQRAVYVRVWGEPGAPESWAEGVGGAASAIPLSKGVTVWWRSVPDG